MNTKQIKKKVWVKPKLIKLNVKHTADTGCGEIGSTNNKKNLGGDDGLYFGSTPTCS